MSKKANPGRTDLVSSPEAGWGQPQNGSLFLRWSKGKSERERRDRPFHLGNYTCKHKVGGQMPSGHLGKGQSGGATCKRKGRRVIKDKEVRIYEYLLCFRHMIKCFIQMTSP